MVLFAETIRLAVADYLDRSHGQFSDPQMTPRNPLPEKVLEQASRSGYIEEGFDEMVAAYEARFGLDQPLALSLIT
ncbi:MAG: hypothetical protein R2856_09020 [Caldilineaceae bacterium]